MANDVAKTAAPEPAPAGLAGPDDPARRQFLTRLSLGLGAAGALVVGVPVVGFLLAPLFRRPAERWRAVGPTSRFLVGDTVQVVIEDPSPLPWTGLAAQTSVWLRRDSDQAFVAFSVNCTHLGCPIRWLQGANLFLCPCHGGAFYRDGSVAAGPPVKPLIRYPVRIQNGQVQVQSGISPIVSA